MKSNRRNHAILGGAPCVALLALLATAPVGCGGDDEGEGEPAETTGGAGGAGTTGTMGSGGSVTTGGGTGGAGGVVTPCDPDENPDGCGGMGGSGGGGDPPPPPGVDWSGGFGDTNDQQGLAVAVDAMGNTVVTGGFKGMIDFGGGALTADGDYDVFVTKFDPAGNHLWSKRFGNSFAQWGRGIACDSAGNIVVTGDFIGSIDFGGGPINTPGNNNSNLFVAKLDPDGDHLWSRGYGDTGRQIGLAITVDLEDNVLATGRMTGNVSFGSQTLSSVGADSVLILKLSSVGDPLWGGRFGTEGWDIPLGIASDAQGRMFVTGFFRGRVDFGGGLLTSVGWPGSDEIFDFFFAVFGPDGSHSCSFKAGNSGTEAGRGIAVGPDGYAYVTGNFTSGIGFNMNSISLASAGSNDVFVAKIGPDCNAAWANRFGNGGNQVAYGISVDGEGAPWIIGDFNGAINFGGSNLTSAGDFDAFVARFNPNGVHLLSDRAGDGAYQTGRGIAAGPGGYATLTGYHKGNLSWTGHPVLSGGTNNNLFVSRLVP